MTSLIPPAITEYLINHIKEDNPLLQALVQETYEKMPLPGMLCGPIEAQLLKLLVRLVKPKILLEIGTFTGYSALNMAEALTPEAKILTCERDNHAILIAQKYFDKSPYGHQIEIRKGNAKDSLRQMNDTLDFVFIDADKKNYIHYYQAVLPFVRVGGLIVIDNALWYGKVLSPEDTESQTIANLNLLIKEDPIVSNTFLSVRDGINIVQKLKN